MILFCRSIALFSVFTHSKSVFRNSALYMYPNFGSGSNTAVMSLVSDSILIALDRPK